MGCFIDQPGLFDAGFFGISPKEAEDMDPVQRLALVTAYEALEMSGYTPNRTASTVSARVGTYYGLSADDYRETNAAQNITAHGIPAGNRAFTNGRIHYAFKFDGPSLNLDAACSSGMMAINAASSALWAGEVDTAVAGGLNIITDPDNYVRLSKGHFLSPTGSCKVWDKDADGYCRADGIGSIVIKRLEDAMADNENILATILAANTNYSSNAISITHPHAATQAENYRKVMNQAGINPLDVSYIELHGTGTQAGDREESASVMDVFAPIAPRRKPHQRLRVASVKSNIGHGEAAAGLASMIKTLLMYQKSVIPAHIGIKTAPNPTLPPDMEQRYAGLNLQNSPWPKPLNGKRYAVVNGFGAHGGNTTILLEDAPEPKREGKDSRSIFPILISARSKAAMENNIKALQTHLSEHPDMNLGDLSYTLCARRLHHNFRLATTADSLDAVQKFLSSQLVKVPVLCATPSKNPPVTFMFTGQGAFYNGMAAELYGKSPVFKSEVERLDRITKSLDLPSVLSFVPGSANGDVSPVETQLSIVIVELALVRYWSSLGITPAAVVGHSLGEYAALATAGVISEIDAIYLVGERAKLLIGTFKAGTHGMLSVRASSFDIEKLLAGSYAYEVACKNSEIDTVITGHAQTVKDISHILSNAGLKCTLLDIPYAFHSAQMDGLLEPFERIARRVAFKKPRIQVISPLLGRVVSPDDTIDAKYLCRATRETVDFASAVQASSQEKLLANTVWVELGPHTVLGNMVRNITGSQRIATSINRDESNIKTMATALNTLHCAGIAVAWNEYFRPFERAHHLLHLPKYGWDNKNFWIPYTGTWKREKANANAQALGQATSHAQHPLKSSSCHKVIHEELDSPTPTMSVITDLLDPALSATMHGHKMNTHATAPATTWADVALTIGKYMHDTIYPKEEKFSMNIADLRMLHPQVEQDPKYGPQLIQFDATFNKETRTIDILFYNAYSDGTREQKHWGNCSIVFEDASSWKRDWIQLDHLIEQRIATLEQLADDGVANRLNHNLAYRLFKNIATLSDDFQGMQSAVLHQYEGSSRSLIHSNRGGNWHTPPHWIDAVTQISGLVMNCSDAMDPVDYFWPSVGWRAARFAKPLEKGARYSSYVHMLEDPTERNTCIGNIYILQDDSIIGVVEQIKFVRFNRVLMNRFFVPLAPQNDVHSRTPRDAQTAVANKLADFPMAKEFGVQLEPDLVLPELTTASSPNSSGSSSPQTSTPPSGRSSAALIDAALHIVSEETGLELTDLTDDAEFASVGVDSLSSLVLVEKFKKKLGIDMTNARFMELEAVEDLKRYLEKVA